MAADALLARDPYADRRRGRSTRSAACSAGAPATRRSSRRSRPRRRHRRSPARPRRAAPAGRVGGRAPGSPALDGVARSPGRTVRRRRAPRHVALTLRAVRSPHARGHGSRSATSTRSPRPTRASSGAAPPPTSRARTATASTRPARTSRCSPTGSSAIAGEAGRRARRRRGDRRARSRTTSCRSPGRPLEPLLGIAAASAPGAPRLHEDRRGTCSCAGRVARGDVDAALAASAVTATGTFETLVRRARLHRARGRDARASSTTGSRSGRRPRRRTWTATRSPSSSAWRRTGCGSSRRACGGGFGGKLDLSIQPLVAIAALRHRAAGPRRLHPPGVDARDDEAPPGADHGDVRGRRGRPPDRGPLPRRLRHRRLRVVGPDRRQPRAGPRQRAVRRRRPSAAHDPGDLHERPDRRARSAASGCRRRRSPTRRCSTTSPTRSGIDRLEIRRRQRAPGGLDHRDRPGARRERRARPPASRRSRPPGRAARGRRGGQRTGRARRGSPVRRGVGIGAMWYGIGNTSLPNPSTVGSGSRRDGPYVLFSGAQDIGQGSRHVVPPDRGGRPGRPASRRSGGSTGDTDRTPDAGKTSASRQTFVSGNAARLAGEDAPPADPRARGGARGRGDRGPGARARRRAAARARRVVGLGDRAARAAGRRRAAASSSGPGRTTRRRPPSTPTGRASRTRRTGSGRRSRRSTSTLELGTVVVRRIVAAHDVGRAINPIARRGPDPRRDRPGPRHGADGGVRARPDRQPPRLPDPDDRRRARDRVPPRRGRRADRAVRREGRRRAGAHPDGAGDPRAPSATRPARGSTACRRRPARVLAAIRATRGG